MWWARYKCSLFGMIRELWLSRVFHAGETPLKSGVLCVAWLFSGAALMFHGV